MGVLEFKAETEMVWTCPEEGQYIYQWKDAEERLELAGREEEDDWLWPASRKDKTFIGPGLVRVIRKALVAAS